MTQPRVIYEFGPMPNGRRYFRIDADHDLVFVSLQELPDGRGAIEKNAVVQGAYRADKPMSFASFAAALVEYERLKGDPVSVTMEMIL